MSTIRDLMSVREIKAGVPAKEKNSEKKAEKTSKEGGKQIVRAGGPGSGRHKESGGEYGSKEWRKAEEAYVKQDRARREKERARRLTAGGPGSGRHPEGGPTRNDVSRDAHRSRSIAIQDKIAKYEKLAKDGNDRILLNDARQHHANAAREFAKGRHGTAHNFLTKSEGNLRAFEKFHKMV